MASTIATTIYINSYLKCNNIIDYNTINYYDSDDSPTTTPTMHWRQQLMQYACGTILTRLNDKAFKGMSPQQFGWLKHPRAWALNSWTTRRSRAKALPLLCIMQCTPLVYINIQHQQLNGVYPHTTQQQRQQHLLRHQHLCLNTYDTLPNWTTFQGMSPQRCMSMKDSWCISAYNPTTTTTTTTTTIVPKLFMTHSTT